MTGPLDHVNLRLIETFADVEAFMRWLGERRKVLGVDTETSGLDFVNDRIRLCQFGDMNAGWAIDWERWSGLCLEAMRIYEGPFVLHNSKFDAKFIARHGRVEWPWHRTHDTMAMAHLLDPQRAKGLKPLSARLIDRRAIAAQQNLDDGMKDNHWTWETVPLNFTPYWLYAALDPVLTCHLYEKFEEPVFSSYKEPYDLEMGTTRIAYDMERRGIAVDLEYCDRKSKELRGFAAEARGWLLSEYGIKNPGSSKQLSEALISAGVELEKRTDSGAFSTDKAVLASLDHPIAEMTLAIRKAEKICGSYLENFEEMADSEGRVHPNIWTMGTRTARMSITDPALQTLPREDPTVRQAFVASPGNAILGVDYSQVEARLAAHFSGDEGLRDAFFAEEDFFCTIASGIFGEPISKKDPRRSLTKNVVYGKLYGAGAPKMAETAGVKVQTMSPVVEGFDAAYPGIKQLQKNIETIARQRERDEGVAYVTTPTGRRLIADQGKHYTLVNYLIQSHAAELLKTKMVELDNVLPEGVNMLLPIHDEIIVECPTEDAPEILKLVETTMADMTGYFVPLEAEGQIYGERWSTKA